MAVPVPVSTLRHALYQTNLGILHQKRAVIDSLIRRFGPELAKEWYKSPCHMVQASIGQHIRHSMDHMELTILSATNAVTQTEENLHLHYDYRVRGGTLEHDMMEAQKRIVNLSLQLQINICSTNIKPNNQKVDAYAHFMLMSDGIEVSLPSTIERELGFVAHHAIHHMAMIKLIAIHHVGLDVSDFPHDFGRAPSTLLFDATSIETST